MGKKDFESMSNVQKEPEFINLCIQAHDAYPNDVMKQSAFIRKSTNNSAYLYTWTVMEIQHQASLNLRKEVTLSAGEIDMLFRVIINLAAKMDDATTPGVYQYFYTTAGDTMERIIHALAE